VVNNIVRNHDFKRKSESSSISNSMNSFKLSSTELKLKRDKAIDTKVDDYSSLSTSTSSSNDSGYTSSASYSSYDNTEEWDAVSLSDFDDIDDMDMELPDSDFDDLFPEGFSNDNNDDSNLNDDFFDQLAEIFN